VGIKRLTIKVAMIGALAALILPFTVSGEFYQYEDENGSVNFTDDPAKIPKKLKHKHRIRDDDVNDPSSAVMHVRIVKNQVLVPVTVAYRGKEVHATFLLDTGANTCTISPGLADRLNIKPQDANRGLAQVVGGEVYVVGSTKLDYIVVGPNRKYDVAVSVIPSGNSNDGLLGMNFLRELRYHIDFNSNIIRWGD
jgi:clan AA aspartic protease (TIGR02281 family)